jgi:hypothetical protein
MVRKMNAASLDERPENDGQTFGRSTIERQSAQIINNLAKLLHAHGFSSQPDIMQSILELLGDVACSAYASGA